MRPALEVINCGVSGIDSIGERRRMLDYVRLEPDLIVEYNAVNDVCHRLFPEWTQQAARWQRMLRSSHFVNRYANSLVWPNDTELRRRIQNTILQDKRTMAQVARLKNIEIAFCSFTHPDLSLLSKSEVNYYNWDIHHFWQGRYFTFATYCRVIDLYNDELKALCKEVGALYIPMREELSGGTRYFGDICHTRPKGMERKASIVAAHLHIYIDKHLNISQSHIGEDIANSPG